MLIDFFRVTPKKRKIKLKKRKGVLYSNPILSKKIVFYIGNILLLESFIYLIYLYWPITVAYTKYWHNISVKTGIQNVNIVPTPTPTDISIINNNYTIAIPKILAYSKIIDNVNPYDTKEYLSILKDNVVAQTKGSSYPGEGKGNTTYIFAHSTNQGINMVRNNAVFYLLNELKPGDIIFITRKGKSYTYKVYKQLVVKSNQIEYLDYKEPDKEVLILQTCWPIGTDWKRMLVMAELIN